jgi:RHS repeat-associated protein
VQEALDASPTPPTDYAYDPNGNRLARTLGLDLDDTYIFTPAGNRLALIETLTRGSTPNAEGQRTRKVLHSGALITGMTLYHYDQGGQLLAETTGDGTPLRDYLWHDDEPLAQIDHVLGSEAIRYLHTDHLKTPRLATGQSGAILWRWEGEAFGSAAPELASATVNLRFPGQYFDVETGLHYNYFRDYDPSVGRYVQSDPVGVAGGLNTYAYTYNNPTGYFDSNAGNPVAAAPKIPGFVRCWRIRKTENICYYRCEDGTMDTRPNSCDIPCPSSFYKGFIIIP